MSPSDRVHALLQITRLEWEAAEARLVGNQRAVAALACIINERRRRLAEDEDGDAQC
jgi:hypothetical protein